MRGFPISLTVLRIVTFLKKLLTIKDVEFANSIKQEVNQTISALHQLMKTFDETEKEIQFFAEKIRRILDEIGKGLADKPFLKAEAIDRSAKAVCDFYAKALDGLSEKFGQEINKIQTETDKLNASLYKIGRDIDLNDSIDSEKLVNDFNKATQRVEELQNALKQASSMKIDVEGIEKLRNDLEEAKNSVVQRGKICYNTIAILWKVYPASRELIWSEVYET